MKYIEFLFKDILKDKLLFVFIGIFIFFISFILSSGLDAVDYYQSRNDCRLNISKSQFQIHKNDIKKINEILDKYEYQSFIVESLLPKDVMKENVFNKKISLIGKYRFDEKEKNIDLDQIGLNENQKKYMKLNFDENTLLEVIPYSMVKNLSEVKLVMLLTNLSDKNLMKEISDTEFETIKTRITYSKDKNFDVNSLLIQSNVFMMLITSFMILQACIKFIVFKKRSEYQIHQFYGSTIFIQMMRVFFYIFTIFLFKSFLYFLVFQKVNILIDSFIFLLMYSIMMVYVIRLHRKES